MRFINWKAGVALGAIAFCAPAFAQPNEGQGQGQAVVTILPSHNEAPAQIGQQDVSIKVNGKDSTVTGLKPLRGENGRLELVILMDNGARSSFSSQLGDIADFVKALPPDTKVTLAYMQNGMARMTGPLTADRNAVLKGLRIPMGEPGASASPYFCLSDLAKHWPSNDQEARREVVMITDGVDYYHPSLDLDDPYVDAAIKDAVRARLVVYSIYWQNRGRFDRTLYANTLGQNLLQQVTQATGGYSYWIGIGNPVALQPYLQDIQHRLQNQYELSFVAPLGNKQQVADLKLRVNGIAGKIAAPGQVLVSRSM